MHTYTYTHWLHAAKAYLQCSQEVKQSGVLVGGGARAAVCEIEAPDVSQGLSPGMGRNGKIIKRLGRREPSERLGTSYSAIMGICSREPKHSHCRGVQAVPSTDNKNNYDNCVKLRRVDAGDARLILCNGIQIMSAEFSGG